jgi:hypothetical protein
MTHSTGRKAAPLVPLARFVWISVLDFAMAAAPLLLATAVAIGAAYWFVRPAPPQTISITSGPRGSVFQTTAEKYAKILARHGVKLEILPSEGSLDNLRRLVDPTFRVDVGFVQGGMAEGTAVDSLGSLGSVFPEPLALFYRSAAPLGRISGLRGKRVAIGREGSGTHALALALLKANGIEPGGKTVLLALEGEAAAKALVSGRVAAAFLMGDSATPRSLRGLLRTAGIRLFSFAQADAYVRRFPYLSRFDLPMGVFDLGMNTPARDIHLLGPTVELVARAQLHPALSDLLIETAREVHGRSSLLQRAGEFPSPQEHEYRLSSDARRYYSSGKGFFYRLLPFWLATLADRLLVVVVPVVVLLIPGLKLVPTLYRWRVRSRIYRWYGILISLERRMLVQSSPDEHREVLRHLDDIESKVNTMRMPLAYADQVYVLRDHISFVRERYAKRAETA